MKKKTFDRPLYYIHGSEECLMDAFLDELRAAVLTPGFESMNYRVYYGDGLNTTEVLTEAGTMPAFSDRRLILIKKAASLKAAQKKDLLGYMADPSPWTVLVFISSDPKAGRDKKFLDAVRAKGEVKVFRSPRRAEALRWIRDEAVSRGKTISREAAESLVALTGGSLTAMKAELEKIILFTGEKKRIGAADVAEAGLDVKSETIFDLSDAIGARDLERAFSVYAKVSREPPLVLIGAIARHMRVLIKLKSAHGRGYGDKKLASIAGVPPFTVGKYMKSCAMYSMSELKGALRRLFEMNTALKTSAMPEDVAMTHLIIRLCRE